MPELVPVVLAIWIVGGLVLFGGRPGRDVVLPILVLGWVLLPVAIYPRRVFGFPPGTIGSMHALSVPTAVVVNKATAIGLTCLLGILAFDWASVRRLRVSRLDGPMLAWCLSPLVAVPAAGASVAEGLAQSRYLALAWGVPYLVGRAYLGDNESLRRFGLWVVAGGLVSAALGLFENLAGPFLYGLVYGPHPYQLEGADRFLLYRPLVFQEHGNQLGMWSASAAVAAVWLWRSGRLPSVGRLSAGVVAGLLVLACLLDQSLGAIVLMLAALAPVALVGPGAVRVSRPVVSALAVGVLALALAAGGALVLRGAGGPGGLRGSVRETFVMAGKKSFTWRLARYEGALPRVAERPLFGHGRADWLPSGQTFTNPVNLGLWLHALGLYGAAGLAAVALVLIWPVVEVVRWLPPRSWLNPGCSGVTLVATLLAVNTADLGLNSTLVLPLLAGAGGLVSWSLRRYDGA